MPIEDPVKRRIAKFHLLEKSVCRKCGALNPVNAIKCRRCHGKHLRLKRREIAK